MLAWTDAERNRALNKVDLYVEQLHRDWRRAYNSERVGKEKYRGWAAWRLAWAQWSGDVRKRYEAVDFDFGSELQPWLRELDGWRKRLNDAAPGAATPADVEVPAADVLGAATQSAGVGLALGIIGAAIILGFALR